MKLRSAISLTRSFSISLAAAAALFASTLGGCAPAPESAADLGVDAGTNQEDLAPPDLTDGAVAPDLGPSLGELRAKCTFGPGDSVADTLGFTSADRAALPIDHVVVIVQENRSFDHYLGRLTQFGHPVDGFAKTFTNPKPSGGTAAPAHATTTCISPDIPHSFSAIHAEWDKGKMDGFYANAASNNSGDGQRALDYYDQRDVPFYYWLYSTFAMSDRFFSAALGPTWPNRDYLYAGTSDGVLNTFERKITVPTLYDELEHAGIEYGVYADGGPRQDCINWTKTHLGFHSTTADYFTALTAGNLPPVVFIDGEGTVGEEHPPGDVQKGEAFVRKIMTASFKSSEWPHMAIILTYDEGGGFFDHVPPPPACVPSLDKANAQFNRLGVRLPLVVVSPWSKPGYVSHVPQETTSITRFIELVFDLPALTRRDANNTALLDLFDFSSAQLMSPPAAPAAGTGGCP
ncbi:MAG TPA: alkaline phosphatase family protein [Polyangia bacterium]|jgi:phospholipase C